MNTKYKENFLIAGKLAKETRAFGRALIVPGASYNDVISKIKVKIRELGAIAAFPPQIALNDVAAHFLPQPDEDIIFSDQVIKLDVGICYKGSIGDCACTIDLSGQYQVLIDAAEAALLAAEKVVKVGLPIREIGKTIETTIQSFNLVPIRNLCGHGLAFNKIHTPPLIPNYNDERSTGIIGPGMTFAIEPFATNGRGLIYDAGNPTIFSVISSRTPSSEKSRIFLKKVLNNFEGLPFSIHDIISERWPLAEVKMVLTDLMRSGTVAGYAPLVEEGHGYVAQAENSVLVDENGEVTITTR